MRNCILYYSNIPLHLNLKPLAFDEKTENLAVYL